MTAPLEPLQNDKEIWKDIPEFPGYQVSSRGRVRSFFKFIGGDTRWVIANKPQRILKPSRDRYLSIALLRDGTQYRRNIHKLVADAFLGPCPDGLQICHNDGDPKNNYLDNLRYDTASNNSLDRNLHGTTTSPLTKSNVIAIRRRAQEGERYTDIADDYGVCSTTIRRIIIGESWPNAGGPIMGIDDRIVRKINRKMADKIRILYKPGKTTLAAIGKQFGISESAVSRIVNQKQWI